jgi:hypothetical protein
MNAHACKSANLGTRSRGTLRLRQRRLRSIERVRSGGLRPSGEDVRHRFVLAGTFQIPGGFELSTLTQAESARPFTLTTPVGNRAVVNGVKTTLDELGGTPYVQVALRVSRPFDFHERWSSDPVRGIFQLVQSQQSWCFLHHGHLGAAHAREQSCERNSLLLERFLHGNAVDHQPEPAALPGWRAGRLLWSRNDGWRSLRSPNRRQAHVLKAHSWPTRRTLQEPLRP